MDKWKDAQGNILGASSPRKMKADPDATPRSAANAKRQRLASPPAAPLPQRRVSSKLPEKQLASFIPKLASSSRNEAPVVARAATASGVPMYKSLGESQRQVPPVTPADHDRPTDGPRAVAHRMPTTNASVPRNTTPGDSKSSFPMPPLVVSVACAAGINTAEALMKEFASGVGHEVLPAAQQNNALQRHSIIMNSCDNGKAVEAVSGNNVFIEGGGDSWLGFEYSDLSWWCGSKVPSVDASLLQRLTMVGARLSASLAAVLQGKASSKLWLGRVQAGVGGGGFGVVAIDAIRAGRWVMPWAGDYIMKAPGTDSEVSSEEIVLSNGAVVPVHAVITPAQQRLCTTLSPACKFVGEANTHWRALPGVVIDSRRRGNAARFIRRSENPNIGCAEIDLPTGPTGVFLFAMRDIVEGEELTMLN